MAERRKYPLSKLVHFDFTKWRKGQVVLVHLLRGARKHRPKPIETYEFTTGPCPTCKRIALRVPYGTTPLFWYFHVATVDTLGERLLPETVCRPFGSKSRKRPPLIFIPKATVEEEL